MLRQEVQIEDVQLKQLISAQGSQLLPDMYVLGPQEHVDPTKNCFPGHVSLSHPPASLLLYPSSQLEHLLLLPVTQILQLLTVQLA